jgi:hypothetical protein
VYLVQVLQDPTSTADLLPEDGCLNLQPLDVLLSESRDTSGLAGPSSSEG